MFLFIGLGTVIVSIVAGYVLSGGNLIVLFQPFEFLIIVGAAIGAYIIATPMSVLKGMLGYITKTFRGPKYNRQSFVELLVMLNTVFKLAKAKGAMALELHIETPTESPLFQQFPRFLADKHTLNFFCDFMRMLIMGADNPHELEALMDERIEVYHHEDLEIAESLRVASEGLPALGIVAAVLGVIHTMGSITEPPEVLGHLIAGSLVGTFLGVLLSYCFVGPVSSSLRAVANEEVRYLICIKGGIVAYMQGYAPIMAVESARMMLKSHVQPSFSDIEDAIDQAPTAA
jgi:chemotaxis protein MotA